MFSFQTTCWTFLIGYCSNISNSIFTHTKKSLLLTFLFVSTLWKKKMLFSQINLKPLTLHQQPLCFELLCPDRFNVSFTAIHPLRISSPHHSTPTSRSKAWARYSLPYVCFIPCNSSTTALITVYMLGIAILFHKHLFLFLGLLIFVLTIKCKLNVWWTETN